MKRRFLSVVIALAMLASILPWAVFAADTLTIDGVSTELSEVDPTAIDDATLVYDETQIEIVDGAAQLGTEEQLRKFAELSNKAIWFDAELTNDIELTLPWTPFVYENAEFNGRGHEISGLNVVDLNPSDSAGFFAAINNAKVSALTVSGHITLTCSEYRVYVGGIAGSAENSEFIEVTSNVDILLSCSDKCHVGGLVGYVKDCAIDYCFVNGSIELNGMASGYSYAYVGGLASELDESFVSNIRIVADITANDFNLAEVCGIAETATFSEIHNVVVIGDILVNNTNNSYALGFVDTAQGTSFENCYFNGILTAIEKNGFIYYYRYEGENAEEGNSIVNCYSNIGEGFVSGDGIAVDADEVVGLLNANDKDGYAKWEVDEDGNVVFGEYHYIANQPTTTEPSVELTPSDTNATYQWQVLVEDTEASVATPDTATDMDASYKVLDGSWDNNIFDIAINERNTLDTHQWIANLDKSFEILMSMVDGEDVKYNGPTYYDIFGDKIYENVLYEYSQIYQMKMLAVPYTLNDGESIIFKWQNFNPDVSEELEVFSDVMEDTSELEMLMPSCAYFLVKGAPDFTFDVTAEGTLPNKVYDVAQDGKGGRDESEELILNYFERFNEALDWLQNNTVGYGVAKDTDLNYVKLDGDFDGDYHLVFIYSIKGLIDEIIMEFGGIETDASFSAITSKMPKAALMMLDDEPESSESAFDYEELITNLITKIVNDSYTAVDFTPVGYKWVDIGTGESTLVLPYDFAADDINGSIAQCVITTSSGSTVYSDSFIIDTNYVEIEEPPVVEDESQPTHEKPRFPMIRWHSITIDRAEGGTITPNGPLFVAYGTKHTFEIIPDDGYEIIDVIVNGESLGAVETVSLMVENIANTISAIFAPIE